MFDEVLGDATGFTGMDSVFMRFALLEAKKAGKRGEVPIGAVVVQSLDKNIRENPRENPNDRLSFFQVLAAGSNQVEEKRDATAHAEILAMRKAAINNGDASWRLLNTTLYTTVEPCVMCLAAAQAFRVNRIVYGAPDLRLGAIDTHINLLEHPHPFHNISEVVRGVYQKESADLLRDFFRKQRAKKNRKKAKGGSKRDWLLLFFRRVSS